MLKIEVREPDVDLNGQLCEIEMSGSFLCNVSELLLAIRRIHEAMQASNPVVADLFRDALAGAMPDPEFWNYKPKGKVLERVAAIIPRKKS